MSMHVKLRYILKVVSAAAWVIVLSVSYAYTWENPPGFAQTIQSWFGSNSKFAFILYYGRCCIPVTKYASCHVVFVPTHSPFS
ncbi:hypothetical protein PHAVU_005G061300 [Phaseolus vulgaris]|nr:hypothetical protein PHAVU_005G061300g [Phaseolus vulgaris]ESW21321.1 hypothetical protein PHAVU_005G061300g [Phaseolus vulgaris]